MKTDLSLLISYAQLGNQDSCMQVISRFTPIINKYSRKLNYDGADTDLTIWLLKTIKNVDISSPDRIKKDGKL